MIIGSLKSFAIECEIVEWVDTTWVFGHLRFWLGGSPIGDWEDWTSLKDCIAWFRDFIDNPENRFEPVLKDKPKEEIFRLLYNSVMNVQDPILPPFEQVYKRFHISHLGMSAFADYVVLLLLEEPHCQRVIWKKIAEPMIHEVVLPPGELQHVGEEFYQWFQEQETNHWRNPC